MRWVVVSTVGWMVGLVGAIGLVVVVGSTVSVVATAVPVVSEGCSVGVGTGGGALWYGWFWYRRLKRLGRQYCFPFPLPFPPCMDWTLGVASWGMVV